MSRGLDLNLQSEKKLATYLEIPAGIISGFFLGVTFCEIKALDQHEIDEQFAAAIAKKGFDSRDVYDHSKIYAFLQENGVLTQNECYALELMS
jgi:hypothetical protein